MSEIIGSGHGDSHNWENKGTDSMPMPYDRSSLWVCRDCNAMFRHYYNVIPDINEAIKQSGVQDECKPRTED